MNPAATAGPTTPGGNTDVGNPSGGTTPGTGPGGGGTGGGHGGIPPAGVSGASCAGFKNGPGITDKVIRIGNSSDINGPVPGLFSAAQQATRAYVEYFNSTGATICGRKLQLDLYDSRTDAGADQVGYAQGCENDFAMVGSMSSFDSGGAATAQNCGLPDIRAISTTVARGNCTTCFAAQPAGPDAFENAVPDFIIKHTNGGKSAAMLYIDIGAAAANGQSQAGHEKARGVTFTVEKPIDIAEFNYSPYVQALKSANVTSVQFIASSAQFARLAEAMQQADYSPKVYLLDPSAYNDDYPQLAGTSAKGTYVFLNFTPFEEARSNSEMNLYLEYLNQVAPGVKPTFFGVFAWSAARLFAEQATKLGGRLTRASLIASMKGVDNWTDNGLHAPEHVGSKKIGDCWRFLQWTGSAWKPVDGTKYQCKGLTTASR
ncbi:MAG: amino acid/amide transporter substrate-binding protein family [Marmoricola sp.]|nr:amino acid/amide transporter substrate-binding protein family [Marmoricola sp.]